MNIFSYGDIIHHQVFGFKLKCRHLLTEIQEIKPLIVFLLGNKVANFILTKFEIKTPKLSYDYEKVHHKGVWYVLIHHPSYIAVYRRKEKELYIQAVKKVIEQINSLEK